LLPNLTTAKPSGKLQKLKNVPPWIQLWDDAQTPLTGEGLSPLSRSLPGEFTPVLKMETL